MDGRYLATMPTIPFAFDECRVVASMMLDGLDRSEIREAVHAGNLFDTKSDSSEKKVFDYTYNRLKTYPDELKTYILSDDYSDSRMANLLSIMEYDRLFGEFVLEVYSDCRLRRNPITDYDIMSFFERKTLESETVSEWKHVTLFKLRRLYTRILFEAGFLKTSSGEREITTPFISSGLIDSAVRLGYGEYIYATLGRI